jgi:hypothetical protein
MYNKHLKYWDFIPKMEFTEDYIIEDYYEKNLNKFNKPKDYKEQLLKIHNTIRSINMFHNDYHKKHFLLKMKKFI